MDIRRRGNNKGNHHAGKPARMVSDIQKPQAKSSTKVTPTPPIEPPTEAATPLPIEPPKAVEQTTEETITSPPETGEVIEETQQEPTPLASPSDPPKRRASKETMKTVEIKISLPDMTPLTTHPAYTTAKNTAAKFPRKKLTLAGIVLAITLFTIGSNLLSSHNAKVAADKRSGQQSLTKGTPDYPTVLPAGKTIQELGGWTLVSPPGRDPVFAYIDKIGNMQINVSQQPLPEEFKSDTAAKIEKLAKEYGASEKLTTNDTEAYIGTSEKGPQSVILSKGDLLILMKSAVRIDNAKWEEYISSLR